MIHGSRIHFVQLTHAENRELVTFNQAIKLIWSTTPNNFYWYSRFFCLCVCAEWLAGWRYDFAVKLQGNPYGSKVLPHSRRQFTQSFDMHIKYMRQPQLISGMDLLFCEFIRKHNTTIKSNIPFNAMFWMMLKQCDRFSSHSEIHSHSLIYTFMHGDSMKIPR